MGYIKRALSTPGEARSLSQRRMPLMTGTRTSAGVRVTPDRALQITAVFACIRLVSEAVANMPVSMFRRLDDRREPIPSHPILDLVTYEPNPVLDGAELWRTLIGWMMLEGNGYAYIERRGNGQPKAIWPLSPDSVEVKRRDGGDLGYVLRPQGDDFAPVKDGFTAIADNMLHYRGFGLGIRGLSPISLAREQVGISFAAQQYIGGFYERDATPGGALEVDTELSDAAYERLEKQWRDLHEGWSNSHRMAILEGGAKWNNTTLSPSDAQFIETMKFSRGEIASIYGVPPHLIGDTDKSTSWGTGIAEQGIAFVKYSLLPWIQRLERVTTRRLLLGTDQQNRNLRLRWSPEGLMQGDLKARYDAYAVGKQWGWLSTNEIKAKEDEQPVDGGDVYLQPLNMVPAGAGQLPAPTQQGRSKQHRSLADSPWQKRLHALLVQAFEAQRSHVHTEHRFDRDVWDAKLAEILRPVFGEVAGDVAERVAASLGGEFDASRAERFIEALAAAKARDLNITTEQDLAHAYPDFEDPSAAIDDVFDHATASRAAVAATAYVAATSQFATHEGAVQAGARRKGWVVTSENPRPSHASLAGEVVDIDQPFANGAMWPGDARAGVDEVAGCTCELRIIAEGGE